MSDLKQQLQFAADHWQTFEWGGLTTKTYCACGWKSKRRIFKKKNDRDAKAHLEARKDRNASRTNHATGA